MNIRECAEKIFVTLTEDYPVELNALLQRINNLSVNISVDTDQLFLKIVDKNVVFTQNQTNNADIIIKISKKMLFEILDGTKRIEDAISSMDLEVYGNPEIILLLSKIVEDFLLICHRSARIVKTINEFRYGPLEPIS